ncbi:glycolate oxidase [Massilia sp. WF1]|uniref:glycolate oxidase subunit GlcE n=1 Tax=unclassified Massilia TaxID=2609279 RepID=UPI00068E03D8|nr:MULTISPECIES: glycolate oxidase subunit GlcE [unclassified Massilia]ALK95795.1 glycolate oxidase [Massilia sp. WG5]KNZ67986.1 glycolate oxidase [Massilia sp. WF1]
MEQVLQEFRERIAAAHAARTPLRLRGGGSKDWYGQAVEGEVLDTRPYRGIVDYEPSELVVTVRCGTPLAELEEVLAAQNQMLAFEPPHFGPGATVGGMVASGLSGPRRQGAGALRDFVLGADLVDGRGELLHFGGKVMKNVAGYDVSRLLAGSLGTLGLVASVSLKVLPRPVRETTLQFELGQQDALDCLNDWSGRALPISASAWQGGRLALRLSGAGAAVDAAARELGGETMANADCFWHDLREQNADFFIGAHGTGLWRLALPSTTPALDLPGRQLIEWGGGQRWVLGSSNLDIEATEIRRMAAARGGHATLFRGGDKRLGVFAPLQPALARIHQRLKETFDPAGIFNPARMYNEF